MKKIITVLIIAVLFPVPAYAQTLDPVEKELGFQSLFDGTDLSCWDDPNDQYEVADGVIRSKPVGGGNLYTKERYPNFIFRFEFKLTPNANSGVSFRAETAGEASFTNGTEIQILDDSGDQYKELAPYQYHGSIYGVVPAIRGSLKPVGDWNTEEIVCDGTHIKVTVNGKVVVDAKVDEIKEFPDHRAHAALLKNDGHIAFLGHSTEVQLRNLRVLPLTHYNQSDDVVAKEKELREKE